MLDSLEQMYLSGVDMDITADEKRQCIAKYSTAQSYEKHNHQRADP